MASSPSRTIRSGFTRLACMNARCVRRMSFGSSSSIRIVKSVACMDPLAFLQFNPEPASRPAVGLDPAGTVHARHRLANHRQSDAGARIVLLPVQSLENPEDSVLVLGQDADAVVLEPDPHFLPPRLGPDHDLRRNLFLNELERIADDVQDDLGQSQTI